MTEKKEIFVWDGLVRFIHWALVLLVFIAYVSGDDGGTLHRSVGVAILLLVVVRLLWGGVGSHYARFSQFVRSPRKALGYLRDLVLGRPPHFIGHNPAAAWMILFLLAGSVAVSVSGGMICFEKWFGSRASNIAEMFIGTAWADDDQAKHQDRRLRAKGRHDHRGKGTHSPWKEVHEALASLFLVLIFVHVVGVFASSFVHGENLLKSMVTGRKTLRD